MKKQFGILLLLLVALTSRADSTNLTATLNTAIPDANPVGLTSTLNVSGVSGNSTNITVSLDVTGGFNGDLYAYLVSPTGQMVVLVNRVGMGSGNPYGYGTAGFNITLDSASTNNIHNYQSGSYTLSGGQSTLVSWGLTIVTVPEPQTWTIFGGSLAAFWMMNRKRRK